MKEKEEFKFVKQFEVMVNSCKENNIVIPSYCFAVTDDKIKYAAYMYFNDKKEYLKTGTWPTKTFWQRDMIWTYYYYLQISDYSLNLEKYLDFDYDTKKWTKKNLIKLMLNYGTNILFKFSIYANLKTDKDFDTWYQEEYLEKYDYMENIQETLDSFNTFDKTTSK